MAKTSLTEQEISAKVKEIICQQLMIEPTEVTSESDFVNDLGADSLDQVELIMNFEEAFGIEISDEEAKQATTVGEATKMLKEKLGVVNENNSTPA